MYVLLTYKLDTYHFYRWVWRKFIQFSLKKNSVFLSIELLISSTRHKTYRSWYFACPPRGKPYQFIHVNLPPVFRHALGTRSGTWNRCQNQGNPIPNSKNWKKLIKPSITSTPSSISSSFCSAFLSSSAMASLKLGLFLFVLVHGLVLLSHPVHCNGILSLYLSFCFYVVVLHYNLPFSLISCWIERFLIKIDFLLKKIN